MNETMRLRRTVEDMAINSECALGNIKSALLLLASYDDTKDDALMQGVYTLLSSAQKELERNGVSGE